MSVLWAGLRPYRWDSLHVGFAYSREACVIARGARLRAVRRV